MRWHKMPYSGLLTAGKAFTCAVNIDLMNGVRGAGMR